MSAIRTLIIMRIVELRDMPGNAQQFQRAFVAPPGVTNPRTLRRHQERWAKGNSFLLQADGYQLLSDEELLDLYDAVVRRTRDWS